MPEQMGGAMSAWTLYALLVLCVLQLGVSLWGQIRRSPPQPSSSTPATDKDFMWNLVMLNLVQQITSNDPLAGRAVVAKVGDLLARTDFKNETTNAAGLAKLLKEHLHHARVNEQTAAEDDAGAFISAAGEKRVHAPKMSVTSSLGTRQPVASPASAGVNGQ